MMDRKIVRNKDPALAQPKDYDALFQILFQVINYLRNAAFHAEGTEQSITHHAHKRLYYRLNMVYDARLRMANQRFDLKGVFKKLSRRNSE